MKKCVNIIISICIKYQYAICVWYGMMNVDGIVMSDSACSLLFRLIQQNSVLCSVLTTSIIVFYRTRVYPMH